MVLSVKQESVLLPLSSQPFLETHKIEFLSGNEPGTYKFEKCKSLALSFKRGETLKKRNTVDYDKLKVYFAFYFI